MMLPQPSFALALVRDQHMPATMMVVSAKIAMVLFLWKEYKVNPVGGCVRAYRRMKRQEQGPMSEEFEMQGLDSQARVQ